jgi:PAS domain S-box-containing protein
MKSGEARLGLLSVEAIIIGGQQCFLSILNDITDRRRAEEALRENQQKFQALVETTNDFIWEMNLNGVYTYCSPQIEKLWGLKPQEMLGKTPFEMLPPDEKEQSAKLFTAFLGSSSSFTNMEVRSFDSAGQVRFLEISGVPFTDKEGKLCGYRGITRDITEHKQEEIALRESEQRLSSIFNTAGDVIYYLEVQEGENYRFVSVNPAFCKVTGLPQEAVIGKRVDEVVPEPSLSMVLGKYRQAIGDKTIVRWEETSDYPTGRLTAEVCISPVFDDTGYCQYLVGSVHDITDRKRLEEEQQRVAKLESVGLLAGGIAHDFNNILTSILGNISLASMEAAPGSELQNSLEQAEKASQRAKALTVQLLTFSKGGAPVLKLASLTELLKDTAGFALSGSKVKCNFTIPSDLWHAEIDAGQVSQVIHNLVINAQQAMPAGGSIEINAENIALSKTQSLGRGLPLKEGDYVRIAITDHGIGIPEDHLEKIFDPFFTTKQKGNGMGLAISFSIARQHGGHISVESELGTGSSFYLYLPASTETVTPEHAEKKAIKPAGKARILVMDDEKGVREIAGRLLKHIGYKDIEFAEDGAEAIKLYKAAMESGNPFTMAILDLTIAGGMGGEETIKKLLKIDPGVKAIVSSGYVDDPVMAKHIDHGFSGVVAKPYTIAELRKAVQDVIG